MNWLLDKSLQLLSVVFAVFSLCSCQTVLTTADRGEKYQISMLSYSSIQKEDVYDSKYFVAGDQKVFNPIIADQTSNKLKKLLHIKPRELTYEKRFKDKNIEVVKDIGDAKYILFYSFDLEDRGSVSLGTKTGSSISVGNIVSQSSGTTSGTIRDTYGGADISMQSRLASNVTSALISSFSSSSVDRSKHVFGQVIYLSILDGEQYRKGNVKPLWMGKISVSTVKREIKRYLDLLLITGVSHLGEDIDTQVVYYANDRRINRIVTYLYR